MLRFDGFRLDPDRAELRGADGGAVKLRPKTFDILRLLVANAGRILSKQELMEAVWPNVHVGEDNLFQCIREIRAALGDDTRQVVKLVSGRGYLFTAAVSVEPADGGATPAEPSGPAPGMPNEPQAGARQADAGQADAGAVPARAKSRWRQFWPVPAAVGALAGLCAVVGIAVAASVLRPDAIFRRTPPTIAMMPIVDTSPDRQGAAMAAGVTDRLTDGLARIDNIRVLAPQTKAAAAAPEPASARPVQADVLIQGELERNPQAWTLRARMIKPATGEIQAVATVSVGVDAADLPLQQSRLAAGAGDLLARRLNALLDSGGEPPARGSAHAGQAKVAIEQAVASINQTTRERFATAQTMLDKALASDPGNVDLEVTLAALQLRGIQMVWYGPEEARAAESTAGAILERALRAKPNSIPVLETYCRFLSATNRFAESLVACARALSFDPWNGLALYLVGLGQLHLGRFEDALATFRQADRFDTPPVSRWTWLLGAGWANLMLDHGAEAAPWIERSIAITPGTGRSHMLLAAAYQQAGRTEEARAAMREGLRLRPGTTALNVAPPTKNASPVYVATAERIIQQMIAAGLPER
ncbi:MAG: winged helix-turn-helix domain-containing protein [Rhodoplanes sp.]|uniref:winged helix-turn-helix domain-containing protein n=1 Tax=Rhodoplanes sp. TaxID=1968906 RepID=UPI0017BF8A1D|nr:winged helix-turn-helix domain-containing protein [Rhodoplanes sp.]NVO14457.1 winged helix-turn-helix domain-containing protein [Rhodoplanes sp.]